jgi:hypothetical protein
MEEVTMGCLATEDAERRDYRSEFDKSNFADYGAGI